MMILPNVADPQLEALISACKDAERDAYAWQRYVALFDGDERKARAQRLLDMFPALGGWAEQAVREIGALFASGILDGIQPGHIRFRPSRRANRRAHSRKVKRG